MNSCERQSGALTDGVIVIRRDPGTIVDNLDGFETVVTKTYLFGTEFGDRQTPGDESNSPIVVAPASRLFSTISFTAVWRSTTT